MDSNHYCPTNTDGGYRIPRYYVYLNGFDTL